MTSEVYYVLLGAVVGAGAGAGFGFFVNYMLIKMTERRELKKTKSMLKLEFHRIYKILLNNIGICEEIKHVNKKVRKAGKTGEPNPFNVFDIVQNLILDTVVLHSLVSTGSILNLSSKEVENIQVIVNELTIYNNGAKWFSARPEKFHEGELDDTLKKIIDKTNEVLECLYFSLDFEWFDKDKMKTDVTNEIEDAKHKKKQCF